MKKRLIFSLLVLTFSISTLARNVVIYDFKTLFTKSKLVFVGRVVFVGPHRTKTIMSYPSWRGAAFGWRHVEVEVLAPIKGVNKGDSIKTMMLANTGDAVIDPPGMIEPAVGNKYLLCLLPTTITNVFAAFSAPSDENQSIFILDKTHSDYNWYRINDEEWNNVWKVRKEQCDAIWSILDDDNNILPIGVDKLRARYESAIKTPAITNVINFHYNVYTNSKSGWIYDVPKGSRSVTDFANDIKE